MGLFSRFKNVSKKSSFQMITDVGNGFYVWNGKLYQSDIVRSCIRPKTKAIGKAVAKHIRETFKKDGSKDIASLVPAAKVHCGETITSENFAEMKLKSISYETRITPSDTSGVYSYYEVKNTDNIYPDGFCNHAYRRCFYQWIYQP